MQTVNRGLTPAFLGVRPHQLLFVAVGLFFVPGCAGLRPAPPRPPAPAVTEVTAQPLIHSQMVEPTDQVFDPATGEIRYTLPVAARVRIRIGVAKGPLLRTLLNWEAQEAGPHRVVWDGTDDTGQFLFKGHPKVTAFLAAYSTDVVSSPPISLGTGSARDLAFPAGGESAKVFGGKEDPHPHHGEVLAAESPDLHHHGAAHAEHLSALCRSPKLAIRFPGQPADPDGPPILKGIVPVRLEIAEPDRTWVTQERFGWSLFVDYVFWHEEMHGVNPTTFLLDTSHFNEGEHVISANLETYEDHIGTVTALIHVRK